MQGKNIEHVLNLAIVLDVTLCDILSKVLYCLATKSSLRLEQHAVFTYQKWVLFFSSTYSVDIVLCVFPVA